PDRAIPESQYDNDRAERTVVFQDGTLAVSNPFFSPNGDGVKDTTDLFFRAPPGAQSGLARIVDRFGKVVRTLQGDLQGGSGSLTWDGLDDSRAVVPDGSYRVDLFSVAAGLQKSVGSLSVVVDNDRSRIEEAAGTPLLTKQDLEPFLAPRLPFRGGRTINGSLFGDREPAPAFMPDDSGVVYAVRNIVGQTPDLHNVFDCAL